MAPACRRYRTAPDGRRVLPSRTVRLVLPLCHIYIHRIKRRRQYEGTGMRLQRGEGGSDLLLGPLEVTVDEEGGEKEKEKRIVLYCPLLCLPRR